MLPLIFIFAFISLTSATAQFQAIPAVNMSFNSYYPLNLNVFCSSTIQGDSCDYSSYRLQFVDPDTSQSVVLFPTGTSSNSVFSINLSSSGLVYIYSHSSSISTSILVYASDQPLSSQVSTSFNLNINNGIQPIVLQSLANQVLYGTQTINYQLQTIFNYVTTFRVTYTDTNLSQSISLQSDYVGCSVGVIQACLTGSSLSISSLNQSYNGTITLTGINSYGTVQTSFILTTIPFQPNYTSAPYHKPFTLAPIYTTGEYKKLYYIDLSQLYGNATYYLINVTIPYNVTPYAQNFNYINVSSAPNGVNSYSSWSSVSNSTPPSPIAYSGFYYGQVNEFFPWAYLSDQHTIVILDQFDKRINITNTTIIFNISGCNSVGCTSTDAFGNRDRIIFNHVLIPPTAKPFSIAPIYLNLHDTKTSDLNDLYSGYDYLRIFWNDSNGNYTLTTPTTSYNQTIINSSGTLLYQLRLYFNGLLEITSANTETNISFQVQACNNYGGCINGTSLSNHVLKVYIASGELGSSVSSGLFKGIFESWLGFLPSSDSLSSTTRIRVVGLAMILITILILGFAYKNENDIKSALYLSGFVNFFIFIFFVANSYVSPLVLIGLAVVGVGMLFLKFRGSGG